ncbi:N-acetyltransferase [Acinetobacter sp. ANC 4910]|uniref:GNAT family N-acetyltransferase n=1 Tax=Acinetobacter sp. ANC 4910 TaxID=2529850 RepID=UPI00103B64B0|nr:N-acetyltransferase [Acinetobacter sp. ANC 4910]TCB32331.1 N-acetyltransferase [Acinetobacter sp. ANC 4910]
MQSKRPVWSIRAEQPQDIDVIAYVTMRAFEFAVYSDHHEQFIVHALRQSGQLSVSLVAEFDGQIIAHVAISPVQISSGTDGWYGLGPVSVLPAFQRQGVGTDLIETALAQLKKQQAKGCVVLGEPDYYARFGFRALSQLVLEGVSAEYFQILTFENEIPQGNVQYHASFNAKS